MTLDGEIQAEQRLDRPALIELQGRKLRAVLDEISGRNPFWVAKFTQAGVDPAEIRGVSDLPLLPFTTKHDIAADQAAAPPYGTNLTYPLERYTRMHQTSGTTGGGMHWLDTPASWDWFMRCWAIIYDAAGVRGDDRFFFPFSFGPFVGFWAAFESAQRQGHFTLAGGGMSSTQRLRAMLEHRITVIGCTPTYALHLAQVAEQEGIDIAGSAVRMLVVAGEPGGSVAGTRGRIEAGFGARVIDHTGMTEIGSLGIECQERPGHVHLIESECIPELIDPTDDRLLYSPAAGDAAEGRTAACELAEPLEGELVLTNLGRLGSPLIRYRTGDIVRLQTGRCDCGRHDVRMVGGIIGRADDMIYVRGNNVYPSAIDSVIREVDGVAEYRVTIEEPGGLTRVTIEIEPLPATEATENLPGRVAAAIRDRLFFNADVMLVDAGGLPRFELKSRRFVRK